ncbi:hypothetical protein Lqui_2749 [Legionella quinlivanii]|uniref:Uncharacterized protein n=1 Tax=Legionella quinlivanii TaxID=45073 RepID=A0A0W0XL84_9GAMM|nr:hypothetical protein [Legionella quinlivanii]KTD45278.1 hypothetical protein Lqui_2749 [Legionella quinlivanii]MCW8450401.1 hypothetical protein [Legionella quinlivanii]SEG03065.1 hypothetical protein SAMN02746093_01677 [Legionella quinlivanii DSM 21216]STY11422.1 Uncharacterised protein [Legionella quinlivanii]
MSFVYLQGDEGKRLYDLSTVPLGVVVVEPNAATTLEILSNILEALNIDSRWLECPLLWDLAKNPVCLRGKPINYIYDKNELAKYFKEEVKYDPMHQVEAATLGGYFEPSAQEVLDFVVKNSKCAADFFVFDYAKCPPENPPKRVSEKDMEALRRKREYLTKSKPSFIDKLCCSFFQEEKEPDPHDEWLLTECPPSGPNV